MFFSRQLEYLSCSFQGICINSKYKFLFIRNHALVVLFTTNVFHATSTEQYNTSKLLKNRKKYPEFVLLKLDFDYF